MGMPEYQWCSQCGSKYFLDWKNCLCVGEPDRKIDPNWPIPAKVAAENAEISLRNYTSFQHSSRPLQSEPAVDIPESTD